MAKGLLIAGRHVEVPDQLKDGEHQFLQLDDKGNLKVLLHGRDGAVPVPVKVDDQGRLVLAGQISLDPGDINIGGVVVKDSNDDELFTDDNPGKVTLTGSLPSGANVIGGVTHVGDMWESVTLVNAQAITDTETRSVTISQYLRQYEKIAFVFTNTLGVQVNVTLNASVSGNQWFGAGSPGSLLFPSVPIRSGNSLQRVLLDESFEGWERLNSGLTQGVLRYTATSTPTSGSLTIILSGLKKGVVPTT